MAICPASVGVMLFEQVLNVRFAVRPPGCAGRVASAIRQAKPDGANMPDTVWQISVVVPAIGQARPRGAAIGLLAGRSRWTQGFCRWATSAWRESTLMLHQFQNSQLPSVSLAEILNERPHIFERFAGPLREREPQLAAFLEISSESHTVRASSTPVPAGLLGHEPQCKRHATDASRHMDFACPRSWTVH